MFKRFIWQVGWTIDQRGTRTELGKPVKALDGRIGYPVKEVVRRS